VVDDEKVDWEIGIWWEHPDNGSDVMAYLERNTGGPEWLKKAWATPPTGNEEEWDYYRSGLGVRVKPGMTVEDAFEKLLGLAATALGHRRGK
jgi:hypothetical protein